MSEIVEFLLDLLLFFSALQALIENKNEAVRVRIDEIYQFLIKHKLCRAIALSSMETTPRIGI